MSEIIVADPIDDDQNRASSSRRPYTNAQSRHFTRSLTSGRDNIHEPFDSEKLPVTLVSEIQRFLRVANLIEIDEPRVAYLCESWRITKFFVFQLLIRDFNCGLCMWFRVKIMGFLGFDSGILLRYACSFIYFVVDWLCNFSDISWN